MEKRPHHTVTDKGLLGSRGKKPAVNVGDRIQVSPRCGDGWDKELIDADGRVTGRTGYMGTVKEVAAKPDDKGRYMVGAVMDSHPELDGSSKSRWLPRFESGLVKVVERELQ